jgi:hypothetical protein
MMTGVTRKPVFWIVFAALSALSAAFAWRYFPDALPLIHLDVKMSSAGALAQGAALADKLGLAPPDPRAAAIFGHDAATQNFVELEAGGNSKFTELLSGGLYAPYWWEVRLFKPRVTAEARVRFRPDGTPYGFVRQIPESQTGPALDAAAARTIAETRAREDWAIDFAPYKLLEQSQQQRPNGRVDHLFVYERERETLGDGRYRMRLAVTGSEFSELTHFVHIPEAFERRFQEMRAANVRSPASPASPRACCTGSGLRSGHAVAAARHALIWRQALAAGIVVSA